MRLFFWRKDECELPTQIEETWYDEFPHEIILNSIITITSTDVYQFLRENFEIGSYRDIRQQQGFFTVTIGYKFKNEEDAALFKLCFL